MRIQIRLLQITFTDAGEASRFAGWLLTYQAADTPDISLFRH